MELFESYERRINQINEVLKENGIKDLQEAKQITLDKGIDVEKIVKGVQPIAFENAVWAYTVGTALAIKNGCKRRCRNRQRLTELLHPRIGCRSEKGRFRTR